MLILLCCNISCFLFLFDFSFAKKVFNFSFIKWYLKYLPLLFCLHVLFALNIKQDICNQIGLKTMHSCDQFNGCGANFEKNV